LMRTVTAAETLSIVEATIERLERADVVAA
jgi:hypothetical protein